MHLYIYNRDQDEERLSGMKNNSAAGKVSDIILKEALCDYNESKKLGFTADEIGHITVARDIRGKPYFVYPEIRTEEPGIYFSVSHSGSWWACLMADEPVGLDIECRKERKRYEAVAKRFFAEDEYEYVKRHGEEGFFRIWVRKEAYLKYKGTGLSGGLGTFSVVQRGELSREITLLRKESSVSQVYLSQVFLKEGLEAAYCTKYQRKVERIIEILTVT